MWQQLVSGLLIFVFLIGKPINICHNTIAKSFIRTITHVNMAHLTFNLGSFNNVSDNLTKLMSMSKYLTVLVLIWILDILGDYLLTSNNLKHCAIGFSGVVFGLLTYLFLSSQNSFEIIVYNLFLLLAPGFFSPHVSNTGHLMGIINGIIVYYLI